MKYGMLIDYGNCTNCGTCMIACRKEKGLSLEEWGITVNEIGPAKLGGSWEWDYVPTPSRLCDLCAGRMAEGKLPSCQHRGAPLGGDPRPHGRDRHQGHLLPALTATAEYV